MHSGNTLHNLAAQHPPGPMPHQLCLLLVRSLRGAQQLVLFVQKVVLLEEHEKQAQDIFNRSTQCMPWCLYPRCASLLLLECLGTILLLCMLAVLQQHTLLLAVSYTYGLCYIQQTPPPPARAARVHTGHHCKCHISPASCGSQFATCCHACGLGPTCCSVKLRSSRMAMRTSACFRAARVAVKLCCSVRPSCRTAGTAARQQYWVPALLRQPQTLHECASDV